MKISFGQGAVTYIYMYITYVGNGGVLKFATVLRE